jgi:hypothetical protein
MLRRLRRDRLFHVTAVLLLALGIGSNTLVFSLVNELLLKPLPVRDPDNLYLLERNWPVQVRPETFFGYPHLEVVQKNPLVAAAVAEQGWYGARHGAHAVGRHGPLGRTIRLKDMPFTAWWRFSPPFSPPPRCCWRPSASMERWRGR